jgi:FMN phosphatase YigB (HAD superfamily)
MERADLVFMLDVDNTLLDNDQAKEDMDAALRRVLPPAEADRFWDLYEAVREETDVVDFPLTLERFGATYADPARFQQAAAIVNTFPYDRYVYPHVPEVLAHLWTMGTPVIVSDGDPVFQAYKIRVSGLDAAVRGNVLLYIHKEEHVDEIQQRYPAHRYVMIDDKERILDEMKHACGEEVVTVHVCQGKYADLDTPPPEPDIELDQIADLLRFRAADFRHRGA